MFYAHRLTSWFIPRSVTLAVVALAAAFFVAVLAPAAHAQQPGQRPDFKVTAATFDGRNLHVEYINATGIGYPRIRYEVGFQWHDAAGQPVGVRHWLPVPEVERGGVSILDNRSRTELSYRSGRSTYGRRLSQFIEERPSNAVELRVTVDDGDRIAEEDERNNTAVLSVTPKPSALTPDLVLEEFTVSDQRPSFTYRNRGGPTPVDQRIPIAFEWLDQRGVALPLRFESDLGALVAGEFRPFGPGSAVRKWRVTDGRRDSEGGTVFFLAFQEPARGATALRITIDPANAIPERDEQNNALIIPINREDFSIREPRFDGAELSFTYAASGSDPTIRAPLSLWFEWANERGERVGDLAWSDVAYLPPGSSRAFRSNDARIVVGAANGSSRVFPMREFLAKPPTGARALRVFIDGPNRYDEPDETDNVVLLPIPDPSRPDFAITGATTLTGDRLTITVRNRGTGPAPEFLSYWFEWVNAAGGRVGPLFWHDARGAIAAGTEVRLDVATAPLRRERPRDALSDPATFADLLAAAPESATHLRVRVDGSNTYPESDEGNNVLLFPKPAKPVPDLTVENTVLTMDGFSVVFVNRGIGVASEVPWSLAWLDASGSAIGTPFVGRWEALASHGQRNMQIGARPIVPGSAVAYVAQPPTSAAKLRVTVDPDDVIVESDEGNNVATVIVVPVVLEPKPIVKLLPDLAITTFALGAERGAAIEDSTSDVLRIRFRNLGGATALTQSGDSLIPFWLRWTNADGQPVAGASSYWFDHRREPLLPGMEGVFHLTHAHGAILVPHGADRGAGRTITQFLADPAVGATHLSAVIDGPNRIVESNETNNTAIIERPAPDLVIEKVEVTTADALAIRYRNRGAINALDRSGIGLLTFWLTWTNADGQTIAGAPRYWVNHRSNSLLRPGEERVLTLVEAMGAIIAPHGSDLKSGRTITRFLAEAPENTTHLQVTIDGPNAYAESNEGNNESLLPKPVVPKPDLAFTNVFLVPPKRERLVIGFENKGKVAAPEFSWKLAWVDAAGGRLGTPYEGVGLALKANWRFGASSDMSDPKGKPMPLGKWLDQSKPDGAVTLEIVIDPERVIAESDEANNRQTFDEWSPPKPAEPEKPAQPDLTLREAKLADGKLRVTVVNVGKGPAERIMWQFTWLGTDGTELATSDLEAVVGTLKPGASYPVELPIANARAFGIFRFLQDIPAGAIALRIAVDPKDAIAEVDERNNTARIEFAIPDLTLGTVESRDGALRIEVKNLGTKESSATDIWLMWFGAKGSLSSSAAVDLPAIAVGSTTTVNVPLDGKTEASQILREPPKDGTRVRIFLDGSRKVKEVSEDNNDAMLDRAKLVPPDSSRIPDLSYNGRPFVTNFASSPPELIVSIKNSGKGPADPFVWQMQWIDRAGKSLGDAYRAKHSGLPPGSFYGAVHTARDSYALGVPMGTYVTKIPAGAATLDILLDPDQQLAESDETNNHATLEASALIVLGNKRPIADAGEDIADRDDDGDGKEKVRFYSRNSKDSDGKIVSWVWTISGREVATGQFPYWFEVPVGTYRVTLTVTDDGGLTATDTVTVTVTGKPATPPDLVLETLTLDPAVPKPGDDVSFTVRVMNRGPIPVGQVHILSLDIDVKNDRSINVQLAQPVIKDLAPGESQEFQWKKETNSTYYHWRAEEGTHRVIACADKVDVVRESDEKNNCKEVVVTVAAAPQEKPGKPDLVPEALKVSPASATVGVMLDFSAVVRNKGTGKAGEHVAWFIVDFDRDDEPDVSPEPDDVKPLAPNAAATITWEDAVEAQAGTHAVEFCVDVEEAVDESNEDNNCVTRTFTVGGSPMSIGPSQTRSVVSPFRSILGAILSGFATPIVAGSPTEFGDGGGW